MRLAIVVLVACSYTPDPNAPKPGRGPEDAVSPTARPVGECGDAPLLTLEALGRGEGAGERIALDVVPQPEVVCTAMACESECCNKCGGDSYGAAIGYELRVRFTGIPVTCTGMDCNLHCEPFGTKPKTAYRFVGKNTFTPRGKTATYDQVEFAVEKYCLLADKAR